MGIDRAMYADSQEGKTFDAGDVVEIVRLQYPYPVIGRQGVVVAWHAGYRTKDSFVGCTAVVAVKDWGELRVFLDHGDEIRKVEARPKPKLRPRSNGTCQGCGSIQRETRPVRMGQQSVMLCIECQREYGVDGLGSLADGFDTEAVDSE